MPVLGHAFVGLATAIQTEPPSRADVASEPSAAAAWWTVAVIGFAYLPDALTQIGSALGASHATLLGHSMIIGAIAGAALGAACARLLNAPLGRAVIVAIGSVVGHDLLDLLQGSNRPPLWPWSMRTFIGAEWIPTGARAEALLFLTLFLAFAAWRRWSGRSLGLLDFRSGDSRPRGHRWAVYGAIAVIPAAAVLTHAIRARHERMLNTASRLVDAGRFQDALHAADLADGWPEAARPGRVDLIRAEAYVGLGHPDAGEALYLKAYDEDPTNFWALADLAEFYASCDRPIEERRFLAQPYADRLRRQFPRQKQLHRVLDGIERHLARLRPAESKSGDIGVPSLSGRDVRTR